MLLVVAEISRRDTADRIYSFDDFPIGLVVDVCRCLKKGVLIIEGERR